MAMCVREAARRRVEDDALARDGVQGSLIER
jgi:hypothetical protein